MESNAPRIPPLTPPYEAAVLEALRAMMPRGSTLEPLGLFRTLARDRPLADAMHALGRFVLGRDLSLDLHDRELLIDRVCARCGCEYEWGVHAAAFGARAGLSPEQLDATVTLGPDSPLWSPRDALLIRLVDELHDTSAVSDELWQALAGTLTVAQLLEALLVAGWYHAIAYVANGARVAREEWAARFPDGARYSSG
jgi:alkylhydroperoxidase family enzyme